MKLGLIGKSISHSLSPSIYKNILGPDISYDLLDFNSIIELPSLTDLGKKYQGLNITSPFKRHYFNDVIVTEEVVAKLGAINTLRFHEHEVFATNTDYHAVTILMKNYLQRFPNLSVVLLGDGVMSQLTQLICQNLGVEFSSPELESLDLTTFANLNRQLLVINACSREFILKGRFGGKELFWDYNYNFIPHQNTLPSLVKEYQDGREMLQLQAQAAVDFWRNKRP